MNNEVFMKLLCLNPLEKNTHTNTQTDTHEKDKPALYTSEMQVRTQECEKNNNDEETRNQK